MMCVLYILSLFGVIGFIVGNGTNFILYQHAYIHACWSGMESERVNHDDVEGVMKDFSEKYATKAFIVDPHNMEH